MNKPEIVLIGGGGHCKACIDVIEQEAKFEIKGIIDLPTELGKEVLGYKVIGNDDEIVSYIKQGYSFLITVGHLGDSKLRKNLFNIVNDNGGNLPVIISPLAYVSKHSNIGEGTIIMHHVLINADVQIGNNCIINNKALIEHDAVIGNNTHISTDANINGSCFVGDDCFIGSGSILINNVEITDDSVIGAGAVIVKDIIERGVYVGNPSKRIK